MYSLSQDSWSQGQDLILGSPEYKGVYCLTASLAFTEVTVNQDESLTRKIYYKILYFCLLIHVYLTKLSVTRAVELCDFSYMIPSFMKPENYVFFYGPVCMVEVKLFLCLIN
jgi:hypothetical protein